MSNKPINYKPVYPSDIENAFNFERVVSITIGGKRHEIGEKTHYYLTGIAQESIDTETDDAKYSRENKEIEEFCKNEAEKREKKIRSNITFRLDNPHYVTVFSGAKEVGSFWSELIYKDSDSPHFPYPGNNNCINGIQICGFNDASKIWGCGRYECKRDLVLTFDSPKNIYMDSRRKDYEEYLQKKMKKKELDTIQNFHDFCRYNIGQFDR